MNGRGKDMISKNKAKKEFYNLCEKNIVIFKKCYRGMRYLEYPCS